MARKALKNTFGHELVAQTMVRRVIKAGDFIPPSWEVDEADYEVVEGDGPFHATPTADPEFKSEAGVDPASEPGPATGTQPVVLKGEALKARAEELGIAGRDSMKADELRQAVADEEELRKLNK